MATFQSESEQVRAKDLTVGVGAQNYRLPGEEGQGMSVEGLVVEEHAPAPGDARPAARGHLFVAILGAAHDGSEGKTHLRSLRRHQGHGFKVGR